MKKQRLALHFVALVPLLLFVWSSPEVSSVNSNETGSAILANVSTGGAFTGLSRIVNSIVRTENSTFIDKSQPAVSCSSRLSLAHEARMNGKLKIARREILHSLNLALSAEFQERNRCSGRDSLHVSWPYNDSLELVLKEATEISRELADYSSAEKYAELALKRVESALERNYHPTGLLLKQAGLLNTIASIKLQQAIYDTETIELIDKAENILNQCTGPLHSERGTIFHNKAMVV